MASEYAMHTWCTLSILGRALVRSLYILVRSAYFLNGETLFFRVWLVFKHPYGIISLHLLSLHPLIRVVTLAPPCEDILSLKVCVCALRRKRKEVKIIFRDLSILDLGFTLQMYKSCILIF